MSKDYLAMIADIDESRVVECEKSEISEKSSVVPHPTTPAAILRESRYGSLTRGGLRDALIHAFLARGIPCTEAIAHLCIDVSAEAGIITLGSDGLYRVGA